MGVLAQGDEPVTPAEYLKTQPKPRFKKGHSLHPLTRYGWTLPFDARVEFSENWGYALEFGGYVTEKIAEKLKDPDSIESKLVALAAKDPKRYPLSVICSRRLPTKESPDGTWCQDKEGKFLNAKAQSLDGTVWHGKMRTVYSPAAPDLVWELAGKYRAEPIKAVREKCKIAIVLNGGEYGLGVLGFAKKVWQKDPAVLKHKGNKPWFDYLSERKANAEIIIANAVKKVVPDRQLYIYYTTSGGSHRNRYGGWNAWAYGYQWMKPVSDVASSEHYYMHFNSGWTGKDDLLTLALNAKGFEIANGQPLGYEWLCGGWPREHGLGAGKNLTDGGLCDIGLYVGFIKCLYVTGMVGGNAGYYAYPKGGFGVSFRKDQPPHWIRQKIALSRVHALFSHLEEHIRNGDLLSGPQKHVWSKEQPAYEFSTGGKGARVVVRKHKKKDEWLICAWAADNKEREVEVTIPKLGEVKLLARPAGSVYMVKGKGKLQLIDKDPLLPTQHLK